MATKSDPADAAAEAPPEAPKGMYPSSADESSEMIAARRTGIREAEQQVAQGQAEINRLQNEISVLNSLRQANGQAPL